VNIGFDAKRLFNNFTGLGNYSRFVVNALCDFEPDHRYLLYSPKVRKHPEVTPIVERPQVQVVTPPSVYTFFKATSLWRTWGIAKEPTTKKLDVFHGLSQELPANLPASLKKIVTVHDLIFLRFPKLYNRIDVAIYKAKMKAACAQADRIVAISQQTAEDLVDFLRVPESKITVVYQGCHPQFKQTVSSEGIEEVKKKYNLPSHYILNVGTIETRKNVMVIVQAMALLSPETRLPLVVVGRETPYKKLVVEEAERLGVADAIIFLHHVPFAEFPALYQGADVFVYPSRFEGFGIPLVEAIESGIPVITSVDSCFSEAAGPGSLYIDPSNREELAFQIGRVLVDKTLRHQMIVEGKKFTAQFNPDIIARNIMKLYVV
jgi:glycosyltransferase involved in cell wall biosynthesis